MKNLVNIIIDGKQYYYSRKTDTLFYDESLTKQCPLHIFKLADYDEMMRQIQISK